MSPLAISSETVFNPAYLINIQDSEIGRLEMLLNDKQYYIARCSDGGRFGRGSFMNSKVSGKNGIWKISKTSGDYPMLIASFNDNKMIDKRMSDSTCKYGDWATFWKMDVEKISFDNKASTQYRMG